MGRTSTLGGAGSRLSSEQSQLDAEFDESQDTDYDESLGAECEECGGEKEWCNTCRMWNQTCCNSYGTCECS